MLFFGANDNINDGLHYWDGTDEPINIKEICMTKETGVIDPEKSPFARQYWIDQGHSFTEHRKAQLKNGRLIGKTVSYIMKLPNKNTGQYVAFVAVRWGFAKVLEGRLVAKNPNA